MKEANKNEIDLLLRSLARQRGVSSESPALGAGNGGGSLANHLDADELNSYAEGVLPPAAQARYAEHLADCDDCRGLVVSLSQAAGAVSRPTVAEKVGTNFWQKIASLFSMPVMKFAVPALMLTIVIGVGLFAFRRQGNTSELARVSAPSATEAQRQAVPNGADNSANPNAAANDSRDLSPSASSSPTDQSKSGLVARDGKTREESLPLGRPETETDEVTPLKDAPAKEAEGARLSAGYAAEPKAAAPSPPVPGTMSELAKSDDYDKNLRPSKREDQNQNRSQYEFKTAPNDEHGPSRATQQNNAVVGAAQTNTVARSRGGPSGLDKGKKANEIESRSVAGRRFVRDGDGWVDAAYNASKTTIRVVRGSEQYRALIADEPAIRAIAEQLDGVVIVVWKSKAYRIQ